MAVCPDCDTKMEEHEEWTFHKTGQKWRTIVCPECDMVDREKVM